MLTDGIADMLTRIRNGQKSKLIYVTLPHSKIKYSILEVLKKEGFIKSFRTYNENESKINSIEVELKYSMNGKPAISEIHRVSKSGRRKYSAINDLQPYFNGMGIYVLTTSSKGIVSDREARQYNIGGEVLCKLFWG